MENPIPEPSTRVRQSAVLPILLAAAAWAWSALAHKGTLFWLILLGGCLAFLVYIEMDRRKAWWVAVPEAILREFLGFAFAFVFLAGLFIVQAVMRGVYALTVWVFVTALVIAVLIDGTRWLYRP